MKCVWRYLELYPSRREGFEKSNAGRSVTFPIFFDAVSEELAGAAWAVPLPESGNFSK